jgi:hypothetical protein
MATAGEVAPAVFAAGGVVRNGKNTGDKIRIGRSAAGATMDSEAVTTYGLA